MDTKYFVKQVVETNGAKGFTLVGTAILFGGDKAGVIKTQAYGDLRLTRKEKDSAKGNRLYTVTKSRPVGDRKTVSNEVGTFVVKPDGTGATLFLHLLGYPMPAWRKEEQQTPAAKAA